MFRRLIITSAILTSFLGSTLTFAENKNNPNWEVGALVEVELSYAVDNVDKSSETGDPNAKDTTSSDFTLATVELYFDGQLTDWIGGHVRLLWEQDVTEPIDMDMAYIYISNKEKSAISYFLGKMYMPFGSFESNMISDPYTLVLGETNETGVLIGFYKNFYVNGYVFNGDINKLSEIDNGDDNIDNFGFNLGYALESDRLTMNVGVDYINNLADSDTLQEFTTPSIDNYIGGLGAHANIKFGIFTFIAEYVGALDDFQAGELVGVDEDDNPVPSDKKRTPSAYNIELGFDIGQKATLAFAYQGSSDAVDIGLHESRGMVGAAIDIARNTLLSFELAFDDDYATDEGGDGETDIAFTTQVAIEF